MKKILILCAGILAAGAAYFIWSYSQPEHYGKAFSGVPMMSIAELAQKPIESAVHVEGKIVRQCPMTGCWFYLDDGKGHQVRVEFGKILPKLPQKVGRTAIVEGQMATLGDESLLLGSAVEFQ